MSRPKNYDSLKQRFIELSSKLEPISTGAEPKLQPIKGIKAVIFDFYGTLFISGVGDIGIDDGHSDEDLLIEAIKSAGIEVVSPNAGKRGYEIYSKIVIENLQDIKSSGIPYPEPDIRKVWRNVLNQMLAEELISTPTTSEHHDLMAVEFEARMNPIWPMPDLHETINGIREKSLALGIISNSQFYTPIAFEALAKKSITELGFSPDLLHWSFEEKMKKPGLRFYERFLEKAEQSSPDIKPEGFLYVGNDMLKDVYAASACGMKTALFAGDKRSLKWREDDSRCKNLEPDLIITELKQLLKCLE